MRATGIPLLLTLLALTGPARSDEDGRPAPELFKVFVSEGDAKDRAAAGAALAYRDPDQLVLAVDQLIKADRKGDADVLAAAAVNAKPCHVRLLLVWGAAELGAGPETFLDLIDYDKTMESKGAIEALGFLGDHAAVEKLLPHLRIENEQVTLQVARALARLGNKKDANAIAEAMLEVENSHVRLHLAWALQDILKSEAKAQRLLQRYARKKGVGGRAAQVLTVLEDEPAPVTQYKVKLETVRKLFTPEKGVKPPPIVGPKEDSDKVAKILEGMRKYTPGYYHLFCTSVRSVELSTKRLVLDCEHRTVNLRLERMRKWDRFELFQYYFVRYGTILFLSMMGDPCEGHRGWEEGVMAAWRFGIESNKVGVDKDPNAFMAGVLNDPPW